MRPLAIKLSLAFLLVGLTGAILVVIILQVSTRSAFDQFLLNRDQQALADNLLAYYQTKGNWAGVADNFQSMIDTSLQNSGNPQGPGQPTTPFTLVAADGSVILSSARNPVGQQISGADLQQAIPLKVDGKTVGSLILSAPRQQWGAGSPEGIFLNSVNQATLLSALVAAALALILGGTLAFSMTRSLSELTNATREIAQGKFGLQVKVRSKDELGELASSFNKMSLDLEHATQLRRQMTADIAHDLRTPLSVISGYAEALSDQKLPGAPEVFEVLYEETEHLSRMVEDLRTLSLADAGELTITLQPTSIEALLERVFIRHSVASAQKNITLRVEFEKDLPEVLVDPERMVQVFDNLVSNAFRYTPQNGEIVLSAKAIDQTIQLQVRDNGCGVTLEDLPNIFDRFYRGDKARQQNGESGLGLAIARSIVETHGGTITTQSTPGQGATFTIILPVAMPEGPDKEVDAPSYTSSYPK
jgi:signal transduction histidine kinase